ncbi:MAG TPA: hypothetical protein VGP41_18105 [Candidatus Lustribacter sp.]|nr:hypothetical protein [Candidatus Lustribacter sp.]
MSERRFDRAVDDVGNLVEIGHVNVNIPDQLAATEFYISGLGLTRDPYMMTGTNNMWVNIGRHQFHLPTADRGQCFRGTVGLVVPDLAALRARLDAAHISFSDTADGLEATSPWGNRIRAHAPHPRFGPVTLALAYLECDVAPGSAAAIAAFYREIFGTPATLSDGGRTARVQAGEQALIFRETDAPLATYDGHHIQVYISDFSTPYRKLLERKLVTAEDGAHQYRFLDIVAPDDGRVAFKLEHEVRSLRHPMFGRALVNRDPAVDVRTYVAGREAFAWASGS